MLGKVPAAKCVGLLLTATAPCAFLKLQENNVSTPWQYGIQLAPNVASLPPLGCRLTRQLAQGPGYAHNLAIGKVYWCPGNASQVHMSLSGKRIMPTEGQGKTWARKTDCWCTAR